MAGDALSPFGGPYSPDRLTRSLDAGGFGLGGVAMEIRRRCIESPLKLASLVLSSVWDADLFCTPSDAHLEVERAMLDQVNLLYVDARGTGKTTLVDETGSVWQYLKYPNDTILMLQATTPQAKAISQQVRNQFISNRVLKEVFPEYHMATAEQQGDVLSWNVPCRTVLTREGSFEVGTPGMMRTGSHYDLVLASDLMNPATTPPPCGLATLELMKGVIAVYAQTDGLLKGEKASPRRHKRLDLNRWHDADLAAEIIRKDTGGVWRKVVRGVKRADDGGWISTWPGVISSKELARIYAQPSMNEATWAANFMCEPKIEGGISFHESWFHTYGVPKCQCGKRHEQPKSLSVAITVDPAYSDGKTDKKKTDRSAVVVSGFDENSHLYILSAQAGRWDPAEFLEHLMVQIGVHRPKWVGIEDHGGSRPLISMFFAEMKRTGRRVPYRKMKPGMFGGRKDTRIMALYNLAANFGGIYVRPDQWELVDELLRWGVAERDDLGDALAYRAIDFFESASPEMTAPDATRPKYVKSSADVSADGFMDRMESAARARDAAPWAFLRGGRMTG